jgi:hypothetical protein
MMENKKPNLHNELVNLVAKWLTGRSQNNFIVRCDYAVKELHTAGYTIFDVFGFCNLHSTMIEVKTSHADFAKDNQKWYWNETINEGKFAATYNIYACPENIIKPHEIPPHWGLIYCVNNKIKIIVQPTKILAPLVEEVYERTIIKSLLRRFVHTGGVIEIPPTNQPQLIK